MQKRRERVKKSDIHITGKKDIREGILKREMQIGKKEERKGKARR